MAALLAPSFAATTDGFANEPALSTKRLSGSLTAGYDSNYTGRGIVISHSVAEGDSSEYVALKLNYDFGKQGFWSFDSTIAYKTVSSGHTLYGNPKFGGPDGALKAAVATGKVPAGTPKEVVWQMTKGQRIKECNLENEFVVRNALKYTGSIGHISIGHDFVHGGILGVMAKHYRNQGASVANEAFITPVLTPTAWFETGVTVRYSFEGIQGWWFEPYATFKAPVIGTPENVKVAAMLTFAMSATYGYFQENYEACANGAQAWWIKLSLPWFVDEAKSFIITPSVSFNWLGCGAQKANRVSAFRAYSENDHNVPFRNFGVVAGVSATYRF